VLLQVIVITVMAVAVMMSVVVHVVVMGLLAIDRRIIAAAATDRAHPVRVPEQCYPAWVQPSTNAAPAGSPHDSPEARQPPLRIR
jgi:hypothetical protein